MRVRRPEILRCAAVLALAGTLSACANLQSHRRIDLAPFAEQTIEIAGDINYELGDIKAVYLLPYNDLPEVQALREKWGRVARILRGMVAYSVEVVTISESRLSEPERVQAYADYLEELLGPVLQKPVPPLHLEQSRFDEILAGVREREKLLDAIGSAQPLVDEIARLMEEFLQALKLENTQAMVAVREAVDADHGRTWEAYRSLKAVQMEALESAGWLRRHRLGEPAALDSLFANEPALVPFESLREKDPAEFELVIEKRIFDKLDAMAKTMEQLEPELEIYWKQMIELGEVINQTDRTLRKVRVVTLVWSRAHRQLASGVVDPAKINLMSLGKKALDTAL